MRELSLPRAGRRYLVPVAVLRPGNPSDLTLFSATALLDTGATISGVGPRVIDALHLESYGKNRLGSATEEVFTDYYLFRIGLYTTDQIAAAEPGTSDLPYIFDALDGFSWRRHADFDVILGMDVLSQCDLHLHRSGTCTISFG